MQVISVVCKVCSETRLENIWLSVTQIPMGFPVMNQEAAHSLLEWAEGYRLIISFKRKILSCLKPVKYNYDQLWLDFSLWIVCNWNSLSDRLSDLFFFIVVKHLLWKCICIKSHLLIIWSKYHNDYGIMFHNHWLNYHVLLSSLPQKHSPKAIH